MNLRLDSAFGDGYKSASQISRRVTEAWAEVNLYCVACDASTLKALPHNTRAIDFQCESCTAPYQLKSSSRWSVRRVPDAGYAAMMEAVRSDRVPNLLVMQYTSDWTVNNLLLIPSFFFTEAAVEKRKPLAETARRAGWVGCNILLTNIAPEGKLPMVSNGLVTIPKEVRSWYQTIRPLETVDIKTRGWTLDMLVAVHSLNLRIFTIEDVYSLESRLAHLHPANNSVRAKMRQQLQVLRDVHILDFISKGVYRLIGTDLR